MGQNLRIAAEMLEACIAANEPALLLGAPGIGKSSIAYQVGAKLGRAVVLLNTPVLEPIDVSGLPFNVDGGVRWSKPHFIQELESHGDAPTLLFIDEINAATSPAMFAAMLKLVLDRLAGTFTLPANCAILAAGNRVGDRTGAVRLPAALLSRFLLIEVEADLAVFKSHCDTIGVDPIIPAFLTYREQESWLIRSPDNAEMVSPSPRAWVSVGKLLGAPDHLRKSLIAGKVGAAAAGDFETFFEVVKRYPPLNAVIADPDGYVVPDNPATCFALQSGLARKADRGNFDRVIRAVRRLTRDMEVACVTEAVGRDPTLKETAAYIGWATRNQDIVL